MELTRVVRSDSERPTLEQRFNPVDPVDIEIVLHEADFAVESYMKKWKSFRERFADPSLYDAFVLDFQMRVRKDVKVMIVQAQRYIANELEGGWEGEEEDEGGEEAL